MSVNEILNILRARENEFYSHMSDSGEQGLMKVQLKMAQVNTIYVISEMLDMYPVEEVKEALKTYLKPE